MSSNFHRLFILVKIHQMRRLVIENYQKFPVSLIKHCILSTFLNCAFTSHRQITRAGFEPTTFALPEQITMDQGASPVARGRIPRVAVGTSTIIGAIFRQTDVIVGLLSLE